MKSTVKSLNETKFEVTCEVDEKAWKDAQEKARKKLYEKLEIKGFRKGHVPANVLERKYGDSIKADTIGTLIDQSFDEIFKEKRCNIFHIHFVYLMITIEPFVINKISVISLFLNLSILQFRINPFFKDIIESWFLN